VQGPRDIYLVISWLSSGTVFARIPAQG